MQGPWIRGAASRRRFVVLALLAVLVQALVPQGYMVGRTAGAPGLVICTGHGPLQLDRDHHTPASPAKSRHDGACVFAGHGVGLTAAAPVILSSGEATVFAELAPGAPDDLLPGRGLAAPPPPSQGPPILSV